MPSLIDIHRLEQLCRELIQQFSRLTIPIPISMGGTGATTAADAQYNLLHNQDVSCQRIQVAVSQYAINNTYGLRMNNSDITGVNCVIWQDAGPPEGLYFPTTDDPQPDGTFLWDCFYLKDGTAYLVHNLKTPGRFGDQEATYKFILEKV